MVVQNSRTLSYGKCLTPPDEESDQASIPGLFSLLRNAKKNEAPGVKGQFDEKLGFPRPFDPGQALGVIDDHTPFQERGIEQTLALIDFQYGARRSPGPRWHTADDTLEGVSGDSLDRVGKTLVEFLMNGEAGGAGP